MKVHVCEKGMKEVHICKRLHSSENFLQIFSISICSFLLIFETHSHADNAALNGSLLPLERKIT